jgi:drug/metabolite transporter (DMT)-like permease
VRRRHDPARSRPGLGIALILLVAACFAVLDTGGAPHGRQVPVQLILWLRYLPSGGGDGRCGCCLPARRARSGFRTTHPRFQVLRGALLLTTRPLASWPAAPAGGEFTAIVMLTPVMVTLLAAWLLKEARVSPLRWAWWPPPSPAR